MPLYITCSSMRSKKDDFLSPPARKRRKFKRNLASEATIFQKETKKEGGVSWSIWKFYLIQNKCLYFWTIMVAFSLFTGALIASDWWLGLWSIQSYDLTGNQYLLIYGGIVLCIAVTMITRGLLFIVYT